MIIIITLLLLLLLCFSDLSLSKEVNQDPPSILGSPQSPATISCSHSISGYDTTLWYQKPMAGSALKLIGYILYTNPVLEKEFEDHFRISGDGSKKSELELPKLQPEDSSMYYCAASRTTNTQPAYFGQGTKLTVLENGSHVTAPTVRILQPSKKVCKDKKGKTKRKTLVCVASRFYPDHVSVSWKRNDETTIHNVSTDATATATKTTTKQIFYKITSRLMVQQSDWLKPKTKFTCIVSFYDGKTTINKTDTFTIKSTMIPGMTRENYIKISQNAKLSYSVLIVKSCLYAALVCFLVWKLQGKLGKQTK